MKYDHQLKLTTIDTMGKQDSISTNFYRCFQTDIGETISNTVLLSTMRQKKIVTFKAFGQTIVVDQLNKSLSCRLLQTDR